MTITAGIDVGTGAVKAVVFDVADGGAGEIKWLGRQTAKIRQRDPLKLAREAFEAAAGEAGVGEREIAYIATTGEAESLTFATGHFYGMTTHARGGLFLDPEVRAVIDIGDDDFNFPSRDCKRIGKQRFVIRRDENDVRLRVAENVAELGGTGRRI